MKSKCIINEFGTKCWYNEQGQYHREDGPAVECADGYKAWYINSKLHREDGPAVEHLHGYEDWYYHGYKLTFNKDIKSTKILVASKTIFFAKLASGYYLSLGNKKKKYLLSSDEDLLKWRENIKVSNKDKNLIKFITLLDNYLNVTFN